MGDVSQPSVDIPSEVYTVRVMVVGKRKKTKLTPGEAVRSARKARGMTQEQLAASCGLTQGAISSLEHGRTALGDLRAEKLARALKVHPATLLWPNGWPEAAQPRKGSA